MKCLHLADLHARDKDLDEIKKCCATVTETAEAEQPDVIVIAGDVFDSRDIRLDSDTCRFIFPFISELADIAPVAIVLGTPFHEGHATEALRHITSMKHNVWVSSSPEQLIILEGGVYKSALYPLRGKSTPMEDVKAILSMVPQPTKQFLQVSDDELSNAMTPIFAGFGARAAAFDCPHILVMHGSIRGATLSNEQLMIGKDIEISKEQIQLANPDIVLAGHIHKSQLIEPNIYYSGSIYRVDAGEMEQKGFYVHEFGEFGLNQEYDWKSRFIETPARKIFKLEEDFTQEGYDLKELDATLYAFDLDDMDGADVRATLRVYQDEAATLEKEKIEEFYKSAGAQHVDVRIVRVPRETVRSEKLMRLTSLRDKVREMAALKGEDVSETILSKADWLETHTEDDILEYANGYRGETSSRISGVG